MKPANRSVVVFGITGVLVGGASGVLLVYQGGLSGDPAIAGVSGAILGGFTFTVIALLVSSVNDIFGQCSTYCFGSSAYAEEQRHLLGQSQSLNDTIVETRDNLETINDNLDDQNDENETIVAQQSNQIEEIRREQQRRKQEVNALIEERERFQQAQSSDRASVSGSVHSNQTDANSIDSDELMQRVHATLGQN